MEYIERQELRKKLLKNLYDIYFEKGGGGIGFENRRDLKLDNETKLAYRYLIDKGFINEIEAGGNGVRYTISVYGIDFVENKL
ncbi:MAG: hypothetical protein K0S61_2973 [Anaerocolumna sp.]|jgi:hypothetical protein|nr:hypothetical protein [Anaerocolumna sp.]